MSLAAVNRRQAVERRAPARMSDRRRCDRRAGARATWFLNAAFDKVDFDTVLHRVTTARADAPFRFVVTPNVDHLVRLAKGETGLARLYAKAWLTACDSRVLEILARFSGEALSAAPGADLVERLFETAIDPDEPITIIGGDADVVAGVIARYRLTRVAWHEPPMGLKSKPEAIAAAAAFVAVHPARFVFFCVGSPQQELVAEACLDRGDCTGVGLCVGASLDFLAGKIARAPRWMRQARLEWLHRLASEPKRLWRRYLVDGPRVITLWRLWRRQRARLEALTRDLNAARRG